MHPKHNILIFLIFNIAFLSAIGNAIAQDISKNPVRKNIVADTLKKDTSSLISKDAIKTDIEYTSSDSIVFDLSEKKAYLFKNAEINYEKINLKSGYIEINFDTNTVYAKALKDSTGKEKEKPLFTDDKGESFTSETMKYNFKTKKGLIKNIFTEQGDGYMHGLTVKKDKQDVTCVKRGSYTTCNLEHPHFAIEFGKAKVIPDDKIVTGPAYLSVEDVPTPLAVPFGFFPNKKGRKSGILVPGYGESATRGFFLENGGYYFGLSDYFDASLRGDIYTRGSWGVKLSSNYKLRYKFDGLIDLKYANDVIGDLDLPDHAIQKNFLINWRHNQDPKARPSSRFSANVQMGSVKYNRLNSYNPTNYLSNNYMSNVSYNKSWKFGNLSLGFSHRQTLQDTSIFISFPELAFNANRFYPFKNKSRVGAARWYQSIGASYILNSRSELNTKDTLLFKPGIFSKIQSGIKHSIPISTSFKIFKYFNLTPTFNYNERWYFKTIRKRWVDTLVNGSDTIVHFVKTDTIEKFNTERDFNFSANLTTKIYGMLQFKKGFIQAIRHVITPSVGFFYCPDFGAEKWGYYKTVKSDITGNTEKYSIYEGTMYGSPPASKSGSVNFSLSNNLEMKVRTPKDTVNPVKKVVLIENFTISNSYDLAKDSLNWSKIIMSGHTRLLKNIDITYSSIWDPYIIDSTGKNLNKFEWDKNHRLIRLTNTDWNLGLNWNLSKKTKKDKKKTSKEATAEEINNIYSNYDDYIDFDNPWTLNLAYNMRYTKTHIPKVTPKETLIQTFSFRGDLSITEKWKVGFTSGYDFKTNKFSYTSIDFYRDLHCWELKFNWIPFGFRKSYLFTINVKSSVMQDLKLTKKRDWRDL
ncbi:MAG: putative LPS assembly protein LptD [Bacteroidales bacterium]